MQIRAKDKLPTGKLKIEVETRYAVKKPSGPLNVTPKANGTVVAEGQVPISAPLAFIAIDRLDIGIDLARFTCVDRLLLQGAGCARMVGVVSRWTMRSGS
jgi:hypothetical protein